LSSGIEKGGEGEGKKIGIGGQRCEVACRETVEMEIRDRGLGEE